MKISDCYFLDNISGVPCLVPFGQGNADFKHHLKLNESAAALYEILCSLPMKSNDTVEALSVQLLSAAKEAFPETLPPEETALSDIRAFLALLVSYGVLLTDTPSEETSALFEIGPMKMRICGDLSLLRHELWDFQCEDTNQADLLITLRHDLTIRHPDLTVTSALKGYTLTYPNASGIHTVNLSEDGREAVFYLSGTPDEALRYDLFHAIRLVFSAAAAKRGLFLMHSVSFRYRGKAWLVSARSGIGKSTHAALWTDLWPEEVQDLNGDLNLLGFEADTPMTYGIPWNGTSDIYTTDAVPLGGIILLRRDQYDHVETESASGSHLAVLQRLITPAWDEARAKDNIAFTEKLIRSVPVWFLYCTKEPSAAQFMRQTVDAYLDGLS